MPSPACPNAVVLGAFLVIGQDVRRQSSTSSNVRMPYSIKRPDGIEREYRLDDIVTGVATGDLRPEWLVRRVGDDAWISIATLLDIKNDSRTVGGSDDSMVAESPLPTPTAQLPLPAAHQDARIIILQLRISKVGGWLILLIFG